MIIRLRAVVNIPGVMLVKRVDGFAPGDSVFWDRVLCAVRREPGSVQSRARGFDDAPGNGVVVANLDHAEPARAEVH
jgi:hypothetical protein